MKNTFILIFALLAAAGASAQQYPKNYFRHPLNIPMELVANYGELRTNHWHMGLDIRTQQRENLPVFASADGYISRVSIQPGGFGKAVYIDHPNGYTTLYAHLNDFYPALSKYVKEQQYEKESWPIDLNLPAGMFAVKKGEQIALSGNTGGSQGPHVHFEIRDTKTGNVLNPLFFGFPIPDKVPPAVSRLAMYDRNRSVYDQTPQSLPVTKVGSTYALAAGNKLTVNSDKISFAIGAVDRFSNSNNPNGIYSAHIYVDDQLISEFLLDDISYTDTRYMNAQIDYKWKASGGGAVQHISPMPGDYTTIYNTTSPQGVIHLQDRDIHKVRIEVKDAHFNTSRIEFTVQLAANATTKSFSGGEKFSPAMVNIFEKDGFELNTSEFTVYDTVNVSYSVAAAAGGNAVSPKHHFLNHTIPSHDHFTVRIKPTVAIPADKKNKVVIQNVSGSAKPYVQKAVWQGEWVSAQFRQFGSFQAFVDNEPPTINSLGAGEVVELSKASRIVFSPKDNFGIKSFRAELNGKFLMFTNDKHTNHIYVFDSQFPRGTHQLKVVVEDLVGNKTERVWNVKR